MLSVAGKSSIPRRKKHAGCGHYVTRHEQMYLLGIHTGHDACAVVYDEYRLLSAVPLERITRNKNDGGCYPSPAVVEALAQAGITRKQVGAVVMGRDGQFWESGGYIQAPPFIQGANWHLRNLHHRLCHGGRTRELVWHARHSRKSADSLFNARRFCMEHDFPQKPRLFFFNHHFAHALGALFHTDWDDALIYTADGRGDNVSYSHRILKKGGLLDCWGGEEDTLQKTQSKGGSVGELYSLTTRYLGFKALRHEGKVLGLAAHGSPRFAESLMRHFHVDRKGRILGRDKHRRPWRKAIRHMAQNHVREDVAASVQKVLETLVLDSVGKILRRHAVRRLALSGGVFSNVRLNQRLAEELPVDEIFVYPAMTDQGLAAGGVLQYLLERDGITTWLSRRERLTHVYLGENYDTEADVLLKQGGGEVVPYAPDSLEEKIAALLDEGKIIALYLGRSEYGPRALGARSILAAATDVRVNDWLNKRLSRTEFMPFAPVVSAEKAEDIFDIRPSMLYTARFMTITCNVRPEWRGKIPAVVHIDGTARPQVIVRDRNPLYYDILKAYEKRTGIPVLINTSFNAHEEPIINTPQECAAALMEKRVDFVATHNALWGKPA